MKRELTGYQIAQIKRAFKDARNETNRGSTEHGIRQVMYILGIDPYEDERNDATRKNND